MGTRCILSLWPITQWKQVNGCNVSFRSWVWNLLPYCWGKVWLVRSHLDSHWQLGRRQSYLREEARERYTPGTQTNKLLCVRCMPVCVCNVSQASISDSESMPLIPSISMGFCCSHCGRVSCSPGYTMKPRSALNAWSSCPSHLLGLLACSSTPGFLALLRSLILSLSWEFGCLFLCSCFSDF